jgi:hypothetical protein
MTNALPGRRMALPVATAAAVSAAYVRAAGLANLAGSPARRTQQVMPVNVSRGRSPTH